MTTGLLVSQSSAVAADRDNRKKFWTDGLISYSTLDEPTLSPSLTRPKKGVVFGLHSYWEKKQSILKYKQSACRHNME